MYNSFYGLSFNPFDKQQLKEKDHFISRDFQEMTNRLNYLKDVRGIGVFTARPGMGKSCPEMLCLRTESEPLSHGIPVPVHHKRWQPCRRHIINCIQRFNDLFIFHILSPPSYIFKRIMISSFTLT